jgi:hypothetical protein
MVDDAGEPLSPSYEDYVTACEQVAKMPVSPLWTRLLAHRTYLPNRSRMPCGGRSSSLLNRRDMISKL